MKLSEAMLKGSADVVQIDDCYLRPDGKHACALGAAYLGFGGRRYPRAFEASFEFQDQIRDDLRGRFPVLDRFVADLKITASTQYPSRQRLMDWIVHHNYNRRIQVIARYLRMRGL